MPSKLASTADPAVEAEDWEAVGWDGDADAWSPGDFEPECVVVHPGRLNTRTAAITPRTWPSLLRAQSPKGTPATSLGQRAIHFRSSRVIWRNAEGDVERVIRQHSSSFGTMVHRVGALLA